MAIDYQTRRPIAIWLPVQEGRVFLRLTHAEFYAGLFADDTERAVRAIEEQMALAEVWREVPLPIFHTLRGVGHNMAVLELAMLLSYARLNDEQFQRLDQRLSALEADLRLRESVHGSRAGLMTALQYADENMYVIRADGEFHPEPLLPALTMEQQAFLLRHSGQMADVIDRTGPEGIERMRELVGEHETMPQRFSAPHWLYGSFELYRSPGLENRQLLHNARLGCGWTGITGSMAGCPTSWTTCSMSNCGKCRGACFRTCR